MGEHTFARAGLCAYLLKFSLSTLTNSPPGSDINEAVPNRTNLMVQIRMRKYY